MKFAHNIVYLAFLYFLQGWPYGFQASFLPVYFRSRGMPLSSIGFFKLLLAPWMCKALWAPLVDRLGSKRGWLLSSMLGLSLLCYAGSFITPSEIGPLAGVIFFFNLLTSTQDIAVDGIAIQILSSSELAGGNMAQVVGYKLGALAGGGLITWLSDYLPWSRLFHGLAVLYFMAVFIIVGFQHVFQIQDVPKSTTIEVPPSSVSNEKKSRKLEKRLQHGLAAKNISSGPRSANTNCNNTDSSEESSAVFSLGGSETSQNYSFASSSSSIESFGTAEEADFEVDPETPREEEEFSLMSVVHWAQDIILKLIHTEGTGWIILFVLLYKLGEQGAFNMVPLFLVDQGVPVAEVGFWLGTVGQVFSILGSVSGGTSIACMRMHPKKLLYRVFLVRTVLLLVLCCLIFAWHPLHSTLGHVAIFAVVCVKLALLTLSGLVTTMTFTLMMRCSQQAPESVQATHYTTLATFEVMGKLTFASVLGLLTEWTGYSLAFVLFAGLAVAVIPLLELAPDSVWATETEPAKDD